jgi:(E)-4-hydroxy-3-methylbut-2-enyl-diphosphate synthase
MSREIFVGSVGVGGSNPVTIQSMCNTFTYDIDKTLKQINGMYEEGADITRVSIPANKDMEKLSEIVRLSPIPVIADIHFRKDFFLRAIEAGAAGVRINPGNILGFDDVIEDIVTLARKSKVSPLGTCLRIGVNAGSLEKDIYSKHCGATPDALVESAVRTAEKFDNLGFHNFKISLKHNDPLVMIDAYKKISKISDWPLHLGVTEAGFGTQAIVKSSIGIGDLLLNNIGDTIRVSMSDDPINEIEVAKEILYSTQKRQRSLEIISCPTCGRTQIDLLKLAKKTKKILDPIISEACLNVPIKVAVMGCEVNGVGEAKEADFGISGGKGRVQLFRKGKVIETVPESETIEKLVSLAHEVILSAKETSNNFSKSKQ